MSSKKNEQGPDAVVQPAVVQPDHGRGRRTRKHWDSSISIFVYIVVLSLFVIYLLVSIWPASVPAGAIIQSITQTSQPTTQMGGSSTQTNQSITQSSESSTQTNESSTQTNQQTAQWPTNETVTISFLVFTRSFTLSGEVTIIWIAMLMGALGALVFMSSTLATRVANSMYDSRWTMWYFLHPLLGSALALMFYLTIRGGYLNPSGGNSSINLYGVAAISAMVGFSTRLSCRKLKALLATLFGDTSEDGGKGLSVSLVSPDDNADLTSPVKLGVNVKVDTPIEGATVTIYLDNKAVSAGLTDSDGSYSSDAVTLTTAGSHSWYAEASKTGFTSDKSSTRSFTCDTGEDGVKGLSVSLVSPDDKAAVTSPVTLKVTVKVDTPIEGATVTIYLDDKPISPGLTDPNGSYSCQPTLTSTGGTHSWYAEASKTGFTSGKSPTWSFTC